METTVAVKGMHCASCAAGIETFLNSQDGVENAEVDFNESEARLVVTDNADMDGILAKIEEMGYEVERA